MEVWLNLLNFFSLVTQFEFEEQLHTLQDTANILTLCSSDSHRSGDCASPISLSYSKIQIDSTPIFLPYTGHHLVHLRVLLQSALFLYSHTLKTNDFFLLQSLSNRQNSQFRYFRFSFLKATAKASTLTVPDPKQLLNTLHSKLIHTSAVSDNFVAQSLLHQLQ